MPIRKLAVAMSCLLFSLAAVANDQPQVLTWPASGTPALQFTIGKFREIGSLEGRRTFVADITAQNLSEKLIPTQKLNLYVFDKKQVRIGEAWIQVDNLGPKQTTKFQVSFDASGVPATVSVLAESDVPRKVSMTVNSIPQGAVLRVDGAAVGETPKMIAVGVGKHELTFSKEGFNVGTFPLEISPDDVSGGNVSYQLGTSRFDTIELRDGTVLSGDLDSIGGMDIVVRVGGNLEHFNRNLVKQIILVEREPQSADPLPQTAPK